MRLEVWLDKARVGWLTHDGVTNRFSFAYDAAWLGGGNAFPLSPCLPLESPHGATPDQHSAEVRQYFENLLPEGKALDDAAAAYKVSKSNLTGLFVALGRETAGALRLLVENGRQETESRREVTDAELSDRIRSREQIPFTVWDGKVRLSIAGYQDKLSVFEDASGRYLVEGADLASTHILKPEPVNPALEGLTTNEFFCMRLAKAVGIDVASVSLRHVPEPVLSITRFDRVLEGSAVRRIHLIDGCQLLGLPSGFKYERPYGDNRDVKNIRDGASLPRLFDAMNRSPTPAMQRLKLLRWTLFQVLIGNTDAHAKNLSFFMTPGGLTLAPAYDMVCGTVFEGKQLDLSYAMAVGDAFTEEDLSPFEWARFCIESSLNPRQVEKELVRLAQAVLTQLDAVAQTVGEEGADTGVVHRMATAAKRVCARQLQMAPGIKAMLPLAADI